MAQSTKTLTKTHTFTQSSVAKTLHQQHSWPSQPKPHSSPPTFDRLASPWKQPSQLIFNHKVIIKPASSTSFSSTIRATAAEGKADAPTKEAPVGFTPPELDPNIPSPIFGGSTGGLLQKVQVEEFYVIKWDSPKERVFEMPTRGADAELVQCFACLKFNVYIMWNENSQKANNVS